MMAYCISPSLKALCLCMLVILVAAGLVHSSHDQNPTINISLIQNKICPFEFLFHLGDGVFDNGNAIRIPPFGHFLPAARSPYGKTYPGSPSGRWSDGLLDIDVGAVALGLPETTPYLGGNASSNNGIVFAVARSTVLDRSFFTSRGVSIPPYAASLSVQMSWFEKYLKTICSTPTDCADKVGNSLFLFGDVEANDITFPLIQGKSIKEIRSYIPNVTLAQINAAREVIKMGGKRVVIPGNVPVGCYPFILTELRSNDPNDYDKLGCLEKVNELVEHKNKDLKAAIAKLKEEYPDVLIFYADFYDAFQELVLETISGPRVDLVLKTCCGRGGRYNYDSTKFCGSTGVPVCPDPSKYLFWDGIHLTQAASSRLSQILQVGTLEALNCTTTSKDFISSI